MISFNLLCEREHEFEGWFAGSDAFEDQRARKLIACPVCGSRKVTKTVSAPNIASARARQQARKAETRKALEAVAKLKAHVESTCDNVGERFPEEARKIHYGEVEERGIYGKASKDEVAALAEEGIAIAPLPWSDDEETGAKN